MMCSLADEEESLGGVVLFVAVVTSGGIGSKYSDFIDVILYPLNDMRLSSIIHLNTLCSGSGNRQFPPMRYACTKQSYLLILSSTLLSASIQTASIPYRQCSKYFYQYIDHLAVPRTDQCSLFSLAVPSFLKVYG